METSNETSNTTKQFENIKSIVIKFINEQKKELIIPELINYIISYVNNTDTNNIQNIIDIIEKYIEKTQDEELKKNLKNRIVWNS